MKAFVSRFFGFSLFAALLLIFSFTAYGVPVPPTGTEFVYGDVSITITDETGGTANGNIVIVFTDIAEGNRYEFTFTREMYLNGTTISETMIANTTYEVAYSYTGNNRELYLFDTFTLAPVDRFHLSAVGMNFNWLIRTSAVQSSDDEIVPAFAEIADDIPLDGIYAEAAELWARFVDLVSPLEGNDAYVRLFRGGAENNIIRRGERFVAVTGGTIEDWNDMSLFEQYLWYEGFVSSAHRLIAIDFDLAFGEWTSFRGAFVSVSLLRSHPEILAAFNDLQRWQYNYILENHNVYNFITGRTLRDYMVGGDAYFVNPIARDEERIFYDERDEELLELLEELRPYLDEVARADLIPTRTGDEPEGIWGNTVERLRGLWFTLVIVGIFAVAFVVFIIIKKKNDVKDFGNE